MKNNITLSTDDLKRIFSNPFYCLRQIHPDFAIDHQPLVTEEMFIQAGVRMMAESGPEEYIRNLLENLKGNYVI